jgi:hypothetical protein
MGIPASKQNWPKVDEKAPDAGVLREAKLLRWTKRVSVPSRRQFRKIRAYVDEAERKVIDSLGGPAVVSPQRQIILKAGMRALQVCLLIELYINREGPIRKDLLERGVVDLQPALDKTVTFYNSCRLNLLAIGLEERKADEVLDLGRYIAESEISGTASGESKAGESPGGQAEGQAEGRAEGSEGGAIARPGASVREISEEGHDLPNSD